MVIVFLLLSLFTTLTSVHAAGEIENAFETKQYKAISDIYKNDQQKNYTKKELEMISYSLRKSGFYREDINLNLHLINRHYSSKHSKLIQAIELGDTIDSEEYPEDLQVLYWNLFNDYGEIIKGYEQDSELVEKDNTQFALFSKLLSELEFREGKVDKFNDSIVAHRQHLVNKIYRFTSSLSLQYVSWQQSATLKHSTEGKANLIITNKGFCAGGDAGYENYRYHFYVDGCLLYGSGGVKNLDQDLIENYQQSNIPAVGLKVGPGASIIVSSSKSRIGIKLPFIYSKQELTTPKDDGYKIEQDSSIAFITSLYSRWQFNKWYFSTEFGKYIQQEHTFWGLGLGREF